MAVRREKKEEKIKNERVSKTPDVAADPPASKNEPLVEEAPTSVPESISSNSVNKMPSTIYPADISSSPQVKSKTSQQQQEQQIANRILEQTKQNIRKALKEAREDIPRFPKAVQSFQDQNIQAGADLLENYVEVQRQLISSIQTSWVPYLEDTATLFWNSYLSPQRIVELYANSVAGFAEVAILANRTINNYFLENMETLKNNIEQAKRNSNDLARACMNFANLEATDRGDVIDRSTSEGEVTTVKTRSQ